MLLKISYGLRWGHLIQFSPSAEKVGTISSAAGDPNRSKGDERIEVYSLYNRFLPETIYTGQLGVPAAQNPVIHSFSFLTDSKLDIVVEVKDGTDLHVPYALKN